MHTLAKPIIAAALALCLVFPAAAGDVQPMPREWHYNQESNRHNRDQYWGKLIQMVGKPAPKLRLAQWHGEKTSIQDNLGKVVVVDFWGTWCPPCIRSIPHNNELVKKYADDIAFIGVCSPRQSETMPAVARKHSLAYPTAVDAGSQNFNAYQGQWYPFYVVVDQKGIIRAAGLTPNNVEKAIDLLLEEAGGKAKKTKNVRNKAGKTKQAPAVNPALTQYLEGSPQRRRILNATHNKKPPSLRTTNWINSEPMEIEDYKGKVLLVDFWATRCGPCKRAIPHTNELQDKYADQGLVILGVCHPDRADQMPALVKEKDIRYAVCEDIGGQTGKAYRLDGYPDYYVIGRDGKVFAADVKNGNVEAVLKLALAEPAPEE